MLLLACNKKNQGKHTAMDVVSRVTSNLISRGIFYNGTFGTITGAAKIFADSNYIYPLVLDSFMVNTGPDLHVYL